MNRTLLTTLVVCAVALAGCAADEDVADPDTVTTTPDVTTTTSPFATTTTPVTTTTPPATEEPPAEPALGNDTFALETQGVPAFVRAGTAFNFTLYANGTRNATSDHVGAHYGPNASATADTTIYPKACAHQAGALPGTFTVECTIAEPGVHYLRGHARVTEDNATFNWWSDETAVTVVGNYTLTTSLGALPATVGVGQNLTFTLNVTGNQTLTSDHIGAHFGANSTDAPSTTAYPQACAHAAGSVPGTFNVTCVFDAAGTYYLRGHLRFGSLGQFVNFWTAEEHTVVVSPV